MQSTIQKYYKYNVMYKLNIYKNIIKYIINGHNNLLISFVRLE